jgi:hypothetical protein
MLPDRIREMEKAIAPPDACRAPVPQPGITIAMLLGHASARKGSTTRGYISKPDAVLLAAADRVSRHIWQAMTGEAMSAEVIALRLAAATN